MGILHLPKGSLPQRILQVCLWFMTLTLIPVIGSASPFFNGDDCCESINKPAKLTFQYTGEGCDATDHMQDASKVECNGDPNFRNEVRIIISEKSWGGGKVFFDGTVQLDEVFTVSSTTAGEDDFKSETHFTILRTSGSYLQKGKFHTSCSQPLSVGNQFGSLLLMGVTGKDGAECGPPVPETCNAICDAGTIAHDEEDCEGYDPAEIVELTPAEACEDDPNTNPSIDCCEVTGKAVSLVLRYTGDDCSASQNTQDPDKVNCSGDPNDAQTVKIYVSTRESGGDYYFSGEVNLGETFEASASAAGESRFKSNTYFKIETLAGNVLQTGEFHTSCSQPLAAGDQFGAISLVALNGEDGVCGSTPGDAPEIEYLWLSSTDGCPTDSATQVIDGAIGTSYNPGFISQTTWYTRWARTKCTPTPPTGPGCCEDGKPAKILLTYTGEGCGATSTSQDPDKVECNGNANGATTVKITISEEDDGDDAYFSGTVNLGESLLAVSSAIGEDDFKSNTYYFIRDLQGRLLESGEFHTSCSQPLNVGDQFGSLRLEGFESKNGSTCGTTDPGSVGGGDDSFIYSDWSASNCVVKKVEGKLESVVTSNVVCDDNGTPFLPGDDVFFFTLNVNGNGAGWNANINGNITSGSYGTPVDFGPFPISGGNVSVTVSDIAQPNCEETKTVSPPAPCSDQQPCSLNLSISNKQCSDNGTPSDPSDDTYTFSITVNGSNGSGNWTGSYDNAFLGAFAIGSTPNGTTVDLGPFPIGYDINVYAQDANYPDCKDNTVVTSPPACSDEEPCEIVADVQTPVCNNNGTPSDPSDDYYTFEVTVFKAGDCNTNFWTGGGRSATYGTTVTFGPYPIGTNQSFTITNNDGNSVPVNVTSPQACSNQQPCSISLQISNKLCDDNGTPTDPSDDTYTFDLTANSTNGSGAWTASYDNAFLGAFAIGNTPNGATVNLGPFPIGYDINVYVADANEPDCRDLTVVNSPQPCSNSVSNKIGDFVWNDIDGDGIQDANEPGIGDVWVILEDCNGVFKGVTVTDGNGMYMFSDLDPGDYKIRFANPGGFIFTLQNSTDDANDNDANVYGYTDCFTVTSTTYDLTYDAGFTTLTPEICEITGTHGNAICDDNGTPYDPSDDTFTFEVSATAVNDGAWGWAIPSLDLYFLPYGQPVVVGPYPISGGNVTLTLRDQDKLDCTTTVTGIAPDPCSSTRICDNVTDGGRIGGTQTNCGAFDPAPLTNLETPSGGSGTIEYMWLSSTSGCPTSINQAIPGAHSATYDPGFLSQTTWFVRCSRRANCTDWTIGESNCIKITVENCPPVCDNVTNGGQIGGAQSNCGAFDPAPLTNVSFPGGGSGAIEYMWLRSTSGCPTSTNQAIPGANSATYDPGYLSQTTWFVRCSRRANCTDWTIGESNCVKIEIQTNCGHLTFNCGNNISVTAAAGENGKVVTFNAPTASTTCPTGNVTVTQISGPASGTVFPIGTTQVTFRATDNCGNTKTCGFNITVEEGTPPGDCTDFPSYDCGGVNQGGWEPWWEWISNVEFAGINHPSGKDQYRFWANVAPASVSAGQSYNITLTPGLSWSGYVADLYWRVWIDFNRDGDFDDANELVVEKHAVSQVINATVQIPANAQSGGTRIRIAVQRDQYALPCENFSFGEMEDYKVCIDGDDPCADQGGDSDGDGVCDNDDCAPNDPNLPTTPGTACNDGNPNTFNDVIQSDGCTCSGFFDPCFIDASVSNLVCNDNGTPTYAGDDTYTFDVSVFRTGGCNSNTWSGGGQTGTTNTAVTFGPYPISSGGRTFVITNGDGSTATVSVTPPNTCSNQNPCEIEGTISDILCDDNGTPSNPDDDTYTFRLKVTQAGYCTSNHWSGGGITGAYGTYVSFGPYPISGGNKTIVVTNSDGASKTFVANAPAPCSDGPEICVVREVTDNKLCSNRDVLYGLWINADISGHGSLNKHYKVISGTLTEYADGTASFTGTFANRNNTNVKWYASIEFSGRTTTAPVGSPKTSNCYSGNGNGFYYYETISGTLIGKGDLQGARVNVSRRGPAFQVGVGANLNEDDKFGASGWLTLDLISQPDNGSISNLGDADFNWNLSGPDYACVPTPSTCNRTALFVVGSTWLGSGDRAIKERLEHLGFDVHILDDSDADDIDASGFGVILISSTVSSSKVDDEFRDIDVPVVVYEGWLFDDMKMTGYTSRDFGKWGTSTKIKIVNPGHPLAGGCDGTIEVYNSGQSFHWGVPGSQAIKVAEFTHTNSKYPFFAYEKGAEMVGKHAPARRVGLFIDNYSGPYFTEKGWKLFDASILWASACDPIPVSSRVQDITQFDATLSQGVVDLSWVNNTGYKTEFFTIEKSMDGVNFEPLTEALPQDETTKARFYKKTDNFPLTGFNYYRLVNHYVDGTSEISEVRRVRIDDIEDFGLFPNPATDLVNVALKGFEGKDITIQVVDQLGRVMKEDYIDSAADGTYQIDISNAGNGMYTLWIFAENTKPIGKKLIITNNY